MSENLYLSCFQTYPLFNKHASLPLNDIQGKQMSILGYTHINVKLGNITFAEDFVVVKDISLVGNLLLGHPAMLRHNILLDPGNKRAKIQGQEIPYVIDANLPNVNFHCCRSKSQTVCSQVKAHTPLQEQIRNNVAKNKIVPISCKHRVEIQPQEFMIVKCKVKSGFNNKTAITIPETTRVIGLSLENALYNVNRNTLYVQVANDRAGPLILDKGTQIGNVEIFENEIKIEESIPSHIVGQIGNMNKTIEEMKERRNKIDQQINNIDFPAHKNDLIDLLHKYSDVISLNNEKLGKTDVIYHHINIPRDSQPIYTPCYRLPQSQKEKVSTHLREMLEDGIIRESKSPWSSPMLCVPKKDGTLRICIDFRKINSLTATDPYPVPSLRHLISSIGENEVYTTLDLQAGFWQVPLDEESKPLTGFSSSLGHFEYSRMPFGLKSSPITFCRLVDQVFRGLLEKACIVYIDDIIILGKTLKEHLYNLELVLQRLRQAGLKIKISKCRFLKKEVTYLGHTLTQEGVKVNQDKVQAIQDFPTPTSVKSLRSFLGLASFYRQFVCKFAHIASPLTDLLKENHKFLWGEAQEKSFLELKSKLSAPPLLLFPDFAKPFTLFCDASNIGIGSCLMQYDEKNKLHPIAYYSRKLSQTEINYDVTEKESLAVVASLKHFRHIILGHKLVVFTDHQAIQDIFKNPQQSGKRARWYILANDYDCEFRYIKGSKNVVADSLSRNIACVNEFPSVDMIKFYQDTDPILGEIKKYLKSREKEIPLDLEQPEFSIPLKELKLSEDILIRVALHQQADMPDRVSTQIVIPKILVKVILRSVHDERAHPGRDETLRQLRLKYFWSSMRQDVKAYISKCHNCAIYKGHTKSPHPIGLYPIPQQPFSRIHLDLLTNLTESSSGYKHILVIVDSLTRFVELYPLKTKTAIECSYKLFDFITRYTAPEVIITDQGREFANVMMETLCKLFKIKKISTMAYMPSSNGLAERTVRRILDIMRQTIGQNDRDWDLHLSHTQHLLNTSVHQSIKESPFFALFGFEPRHPLEVPNSKYLSNPDDNPIITRINNSLIRHQGLRKKLFETNIIMQKKQHQRSKTENFAPGDLVYKKIDVMSGQNYKLGPKFTGPYQVEKSLGLNKYEIRDVETEEKKITHADKLKMYKPSDIENVQEEEEDVEEEKEIETETSRPRYLRQIARKNYAEN